MEGGVAVEFSLKFVAKNGRGLGTAHVKAKSRASCKSLKI